MLYLLVYVLFPLLVGCVLFFLAYTFAVRRRAVQGAKREFFWAQLRSSWQLGIDQNMSPQTLEDVNSRLNTLCAFLLLGGGIAMLLVAVLMTCVALITTGTLLVGNAWPVELFVPLLLVLIFVGFWLGAMEGFRHIKRGSTYSISFGDLRRRLAADYRSPLLLVPPVLFIAMNIAEALVSMTGRHSLLRVVLMNDVVLQLPTWILLVMPVAMTLFVLMVEGCISSIVRFPRLLITADLDIAQRADDMLRAAAIGLLLTCEYFILGSLTWAQNGFLFSIMSDMEGLGLVVTIVNTWVWPMLWGNLLGLARLGHLGGRVSGWPGSTWRGTVAANRQS